MSSKIFEEEGKEPVAGGMATAQQKIEKQARQLAYDTRYQVKKEIGNKAVPPAAMKRLLLQRLQKSSAAPNVKLRAKQMLLGEDYIGNVSDFASDRIANALLKVFVEGVEKVSEDIQLEYLKELDENPNKKYKVRVTDKKTGNSYVRYATREKITQLRSNPNIQSVEMTEYGEPREGERKGGEDTARATGGGMAKKDYDGDGKVESSAKEHAGAVHNAIQRKKGLPADGKDTTGIKEGLVGKQKNIDVAEPYGKLTGADFKKLSKAKVAEEFLADAATENQNTGKITGKDVNNYAGKNPAVKIMPEDPFSDRVNTGTAPRSVYAHYESEGEVIAETGYSKFLNMIQEKKMTKVAKQKEKKLKAKYDKSGMKASMKKQYGERGEDVYFATIRKQAMKEESESGYDEKPKASKGETCDDDPRSMKTQVNLVKNKLRAMGLKMSYEPEGEMVDEARAEEKRGLGSTGSERQRMKSGESGPRGRRPVTSFSGGQNPHLRGKTDLNKTERRAKSRRYVDQPGGPYGGPENEQGAGRYAKMQAKKRDQSHMHSPRD